ncbi:MAG: molybdopterin-dependent oxidoreductase [Nocardioidaceae bacterium]
MSSRLRPPREADFSSPLRDDRVTSRVGLWLGIAFLVAFLTGVFSHYGQDTPGWFTYPTGPVSLYRITQGIHVLAGTAAVPLLLVKLWSVYPKLFARLPWPPSRAGLVNGLERASVVVLVSSAIFQLVTGLQNMTHWYPWGFSFRSGHYAVAWVAIGSILVHVAVKLPIIRDALALPIDAATPMPVAERDINARVADPALSRRALLRTTWAAAGLAVLATAGQSVSWLRDVSIFGVRSGDGPQGVPVNRSSVEAGVTKTALDPGWRLTLVNGSVKRQLTRAELEAMPQHTRSLPIACVEGWSAGATWTGVLMADLAALVDAPADSELFISSLDLNGTFGTSTLPPQFTANSNTLLALKVNGETLDIEHGYPCRVIAPARPGVLQTKWVTSLEVVA